MQKNPDNRTTLLDVFRNLGLELSMIDTYTVDSKRERKGRDNQAGK